MSQMSKGSKFSTMTKDDLKLYFKEKQEQLEEDSKSRISMISRGQFGKKEFSIKKDRKPQALSVTNSNTLQPQSPRTYRSPEKVQKQEDVEEISYKSDLEGEEEAIALGETVDDTNARDQSPDLEGENLNTEVVDLENVNDDLLDQECQKLAAQISAEQTERTKILEQLEQMKEASKTNERVLALQQNNDQALKMQVYDQRNLMASSQNYTTHCDFSV